MLNMGAFLCSSVFAIWLLKKMQLFSIDAENIASSSFSSF